MTRSGYSDCLDQRELAMYRGRVMSAIRGKRGQQLLRDCLAALDALPEKKLIARDLMNLTTREVCALGAGAIHRALNVKELQQHLEDDPDTIHAELAHQLNAAECLLREIEFVNDEAAYSSETPEQRFKRVRVWLVEQIRKDSR